MHKISLVDSELPSTSLKVVDMTMLCLLVARNCACGPLRVEGLATHCRIGSWMHESVFPIEYIGLTLNLS